jgi:hypothetical protein
VRDLCAHSAMCSRLDGQHCPFETTLHLKVTNKTLEVWRQYLAYFCGRLRATKKAVTLTVNIICAISSCHRDIQHSNGYEKALGKLPDDGNVMPKHVGATIHN